jgi:exodeoxyribonuclease V alpha subunit
MHVGVVCKQQSKSSTITRNTNMTTADQAIERRVAVEDIVLDEYQTEAVRRCTDMSSTSNRVIPISGPAGTGKTTIIRQVFDILTKASYSVVLCAPTGKAAKRIYEATGIPAMTIHRLLKYPHPGERDEKTGRPLVTTDPRHNADDPLGEDVVICDEYAMVNREVHSNLIFALKRGARLLMFGDVNQLQPIERTVLARRSDSPFQRAMKKFSGVELQINHRQREGSGISDAGLRILHRQVPRRTSDFELAMTAQPVERVVSLIERLHGEGYDFGNIHAQVLTTSKRSWIGTEKLNITLQALLNRRPRDEMIHVPRHKWIKTKLYVAVGDKVIWTENMYDLREYEEIFDERGKHVGGIAPPNKYILNGESGVLLECFEDGGMVIDVGDRRVDVPGRLHVMRRDGEIVPIDPRRSLDLGYVITTHKAQGSEYRAVIYVLNKTTAFNQCQPNMYTAVTRAREHCVVVSDQSSFNRSLQNITSLMDRKGQ